MALETEKAEALPCREVFVTYEALVYILVIIHAVCRNLDLGIRAGDKVHMFALGKTDNKFLDKCGHVAVGDNGTFPFLDVEDAGRNLYGKVVFDLNLTSETPALLLLSPTEVYDLGRQNVSPTLGDTHTTLAAAAFATASTG